ncbi:hypothetical protein GOP47_0022453 [Adiantum capillus-veneris]|uniref:Uncharacterized protein n=1 Tax=Adiantum capillus-veneris TaxID=13818 RepID=A0A9D4Z5C7_ADICA|nr:hypothetical protein GOP47_0022453 [Adiantum capillus-veneris]
MARRLFHAISHQSIGWLATRGTQVPSPVSHLCDPVSKHPWMLTTVQHYAKRRSKFAKDPYAWIKVGKDEECPSSQPNKGSVKNRNQKKRMAQKAAFIKAEAQKRIAQCKAADAKRLEARKKRWKEGAARARAWKEKKLAEAKEAEAQQAQELAAA